MTEADIEKLAPRLQDPLWRLCSGELYKIRTADGQGIIPFRPRPEQIKIAETIYGRRWDPETASSEETGEPKRKIVIPKARRLGMSTTLGLYQLDRAIFCPGFQSSLVDQNAGDAAKKLDGIVKVGLDNLPEWLAGRIARGKDNDSHLELSLVGRDKSDIFAGMNARGGSNDFLWVSEWGVIQFEDPKRSTKIRSGALPSARHGVTVVETTWAGGKGGDVWDLIKPALEGTADEWTILFFPWWLDPRNVAPDAAMDAEAVQYFERIATRLEREGVELSDAQRRWWAAERREQGIFMARENPTFLDECWSSPVKGAIYADAIDCARTEGRVVQEEYAQLVAGDALVHTAWDLGAPQQTVVWYFQIVGREIRVIDCDLGGDETIIERGARMLASGYNFGKHYLPHDAESKERTGRTLKGEMAEAGLSNLVCVPRTHSVWVGINHLRELFPSLVFSHGKCNDALETLACYRMREEREGSRSLPEPIHDFASHPADALRTMAEAHLSGLFKFSHTPAMPEPDRYLPKRARRGLKPMRVS